MKLSVEDRLVLMNSLSKEGDVVTLRVLRDLMQRLGFTEEEHALLKFKEEGTTVKWDPKALGDVEILIGPKAHTLILTSFERLNSTKTMPIAYLPTYEKFEKGE